MARPRALSGLAGTWRVQFVESAASAGVWPRSTPVPAADPVARGRRWPIPRPWADRFSCELGVPEWFAAITPTAIPDASGIAMRVAMSAGLTRDVRRHAGPRLKCIRPTSVSAPNALSVSPSSRTVTLDPAVTKMWPNGRGHFLPKYYVVEERAPPG